MERKGADPSQEEISLERDGNSRPCSAQAKPYSKPILSVLEDIRDVTLGGSPGTGDSAAQQPEYP